MIIKFTLCSAYKVMWHWPHAHFGLLWMSGPLWKVHVRKSRSIYALVSLHLSLPELLKYRVVILQISEKGTSRSDHCTSNLWCSTIAAEAGKQTKCRTACAWTRFRTSSIVRRPLNKHELCEFRNFRHTSVSSRLGQNCCLVHVARSSDLSAT